MDNEIEKLQQAKVYMDYLANGVDPISGTDANSDILHNEQVAACFRYISDVLAMNIYEAENSAKHKTTDFYITEEQKSELKVYAHNCKVSELADEINRATAVNGTRKLAVAIINDWLEHEGYLCKSN